MAKTIITLKDDLSLAVIQHAIEREERLLTLAINQVEEKLAAFEARFGTRDRQSLFGTVDDMNLIEWEGEEDTLVRLRQRLQRLKEIQVEPR